MYSVPRSTRSSGSPSQRSAYSDNTHEIHYFAGSRRLATVRRNGLAHTGSSGNSYLRTHYHHSNHVGSNTLVTDSNGNPVRETVLGPFGETLYEPLSSSNSPYVFTNQERDPQTDLDYFGARYYDPWVGRFMSVDPESLGGVTFGRMGADSQNANVYSYSRNSPTVLIDPSGRSAECSQTTGGACTQVFGGATSTTYHGDGSVTRSEQGSDGTG